MRKAALVARHLPSSAGSAALLAAAASLAAAAGCAEEVPWAHLQAEVVRPEDGPAVAGRLRVAILWANVSPDPGPQVVASEGGWVPQSEAPFAIPLRGELPDGALRTLASGEQRAFGGLVVYDDVDRDWRFTATAAAGPLRDRVVGWVPGFRIRYDLDPARPDARPELTLESRQEPGATWIEPLSTVLPLRLFAAEDAACLGLDPLPYRFPAGAAAEVAALDPRPASFWPFPVGVADCPDNRLPDDWWSVACVDRENATHIVRTLHWPVREELAEMCGWTMSMCWLRVEPGDTPTREVPPCD